MYTQKRNGVNLEPIPRKTPEWIIKAMRVAGMFGLAVGVFMFSILALIPVAAIYIFYRESKEAIKKEIEDDLKGFL